MDNLTQEQRHKNMQHIRSKDSIIEIKFRKALWHKGYRYRKNYKKLPGKPDIVLTKYKIAVFCDGEFFHGKDWEVLKPRLEKSVNGEYWKKKISRNMERDEEVNIRLLFLGWTVIRFWGKDILTNTDECIRVIEEAIFENRVSMSALDELQRGRGIFELQPFCYLTYVTGCAVCCYEERKMIDICCIFDVNVII